MTKPYYVTGVAFTATALAAEQWTAPYTVIPALVLFALFARQFAIVERRERRKAKWAKGLRYVNGGQVVRRSHGGERPE